MTYRLSDLEIPSDDPFKNDALGRREVVEFLSALIKRLDGPFVMALDSPWGTGKTTLVQMLKADLQAKNVQCVYFNAWKVDYVTDPLVALVASIDSIDLGAEGTNDEFEKHLKIVKKVATLVAKRGLMAATKAVTLGVLDLEKDYETLAAELTAGTMGDVVDAFKGETELLEKFRDELELAVKQLPVVSKDTTGKEPNLVIFIDELDRCRPSFAIEMLERIKHLFDIPQIVFVLSIDKQQLETSTAAVYGSGINAPEYLRRFIDLEYGIPAANSERYTEALLNRFDLTPVFAERTASEFTYDKKQFIEFFTILANAFGLSLRVRERCMTRLRIVLDQTPSNHYLDPILVALLIVLRSNKSDLFTRIVAGEAPAETVMEYLATLPNGAELTSGLTGMVFETFLIAADSNRSRRKNCMEKMRIDTKGRTLSRAVRNHAKELLGMLEDIQGGLRGDINLADIVTKIDLAAMVKD